MLSIHLKFSKHIHPSGHPPVCIKLLKNTKQATEMKLCGPGLNLQT